jgi:hypothetical protein
MKVSSSDTFDAVISKKLRIIMNYLNVNEAAKILIDIDNLGAH